MKHAHSSSILAYKLYLAGNTGIKRIGAPPPNCSGFAWFLVFQSNRSSGVRANRLRQLLGAATLNWRQHRNEVKVKSKWHQNEPKSGRVQICDQNQGRERTPKGQKTDARTPKCQHGWSVVGGGVGVGNVKRRTNERPNACQRRQSFGAWRVALKTKAQPATQAPNRALGGRKCGRSDRGRSVVACR
jgi:hypothetical protein